MSVCAINMMYMRYEKFFEDAFHRINEMLFNSQLIEASLTIWIGVDTNDYIGCFVPPMHPESDLQISVSSEFIWNIRNEKNKERVIAAIILLLLHEAVHLYCWQFSIDGTAHNENFSRIAEEHGLHAIYENNERVEEWLTDKGMEVVKSFVR